MLHAAPRQQGESRSPAPSVLCSSLGYEVRCQNSQQRFFHVNFSLFFFFGALFKKKSALLKKRALQRNSFTAQCHFHSKYLCICELCFTKRKIFQILPNTYSLENKASCSGRALRRATQASGCRAALLKRTSLFSYSTVSQVLHQ